MSVSQRPCLHGCGLQGVEVPAVGSALHQHSLAEGLESKARSLQCQHLKCASESILHQDALFALHSMLQLQ